MKLAGGGYIEAATHGADDHIFMGDSDFNALPQSATMNVSNNPVPKAGHPPSC